MPKKTVTISHDKGNTIILQVKLNQPNLHEAIVANSSLNKALDEVSKFEVSRGRKETRNIKTFDFSSQEWPEIKFGTKLFRSTFRKTGTKVKETRNPNYYLYNQHLTAQKLSDAIRNHWGIENSNHHIRDNVLFEDKNRIRIKPENMMIIRSFGYNLIQANKGEKAFTAQVETNKLNFENIFCFKGVGID